MPTAFVQLNSRSPAAPPPLQLIYEGSSRPQFPWSARSFWDELEGLGRRPLSSRVPRVDGAPLRIRDEMPEGGYLPLKLK